MTQKHMNMRPAARLAAGLPHRCSYRCIRPECAIRQRNELLDEVRMLQEQNTELDRKLAALKERNA